MPWNWLCLLASLFGHAIAAPFVALPFRALAFLAVVVVVAAGRARWPWLLLALLAGAVGGWQLWPPAALSDLVETRRRIAAVETLTLDHEGRADVWLRVAGFPPFRAQLRDLPPELGPGSRFVAEVDLWLPSAPRNPDDRDARRAALARRSSLRGRVREVRGVGVSFGPGSRERGRESLRSEWRAQMGGGGKLWEALLLGDGRALGTETRDRFARLGLAHMLALSGMHVGIVTGLLLIPLRRWGRNSLALSLPILIAWAWMAGAGPSLVRAVGMVAWLAIARALRRPTNAADALVSLALLESVARPWQLCSLGWWLSYSATLGIVRALPTLQRLPKWLAPLGLSWVAQLSTAPWSLDAFGRIVWMGPFIQLVIGVPFAFLLASGALAWIVTSLIPVLGPMVWSLVGTLAHGFGALLTLVEAISPPPVGHPGLRGGLGVALLVLVLVLPPWRRWRRCRWGVSALLLLVVHLPGLGVTGETDALRWTTLDVGQGDGGLYRGRQASLMIDAGPWSEHFDPGARILLPHLERRNMKGVTLAITHGHLDHYGGAPALLRSGRVETLVVARTDSAESWVQRLHAIQPPDGEIALRFLSRGDTLWLGDEAVPCLWPPSSGPQLHTNDRSLVLRVGPSDRALLATGDLEREGERGLLEELANSGDRFVALKVAHHGGNTGTDLPLLKRVAPRWALISCGRGNRYGHPHQAVMGRLATSGIPTLRTDECGALELVWAESPGPVQLRSRRSSRPSIGWP